MAAHCIFCKIVSREIPSQPIYEDEQVLAFPDIKPAAPVHVLVIPKEHVDGISAVAAGSKVLSLLADKAVLIAKQLGIAEKGFRLVVNDGDDGGQTVYHLHLHLLGGRFMGWPPG